MRLVEAALPGFGSFLMAFHRELILFLAGYAEFTGHEIARLTHGEASGRLFDSRRLGCQVTSFEIADQFADSLASGLQTSEVLEEVRCFLAEKGANGADRFHAACEANLDLSGQDLSRNSCHRFTGRSAVAVHRRASDARRHTRIKESFPGDI